VLCRHGEAEGAAGRFCGSFDPPLSATGRGHAEALAAALGGSVVYSSPARRALETAQEIGEPIVDPDLAELDFGEADGLTYDEAAARWPALYEAWLRAPTEVTFPGGEVFADFRARALGALGRIDRDAVVVTHGGVVRTALASWLAMPDEALFRIDAGYGCVSVVEWHDGTPLVRLVNAPPASLAPAG
jgi:ribonuclease H / adenosylcobalamin/alpha-ribazole phosphatase